MAMGVTVWDPQNGRIVSAGRNAQTKIEAPNRPDCEWEWAAGTLRNARAENCHEIDRIVSGMGARNGPVRQMTPKPLLERPGVPGEIEPQYRPTVGWNQASSLFN